MEYTIKHFAEKEKERLKLERLGKQIKIAMILASQDTASKKYIENKKKLLKEFEIEYQEHILNNPTQSELNNLLDRLSQDKNITGIMLELPLNKGLDSEEAIEHIDYKKDVDGLTNYHLGKLIKNRTKILPCTVSAVAKILDNAKINLEGKNVVIVGRSILLGKPLQLYLTNKNATTTLCHSKTQNLKEITSKADILVVAIGKAKYITKEYIKQGSFVIDVGTNYINGKLYGDVDFDNVSDENNFVTPVPNGVGLLTKICMIENLIKLIDLNN
ncbi:MAG: bifunctional 5,10-methylenetetrahydrofolate dehydrogenase/5,10-methenyltetrahydrofolate cyclohydrolase [Clostridia bacterium]|nr:bifunctional 5,10-methylenetetrahydrofolate dehydrogenase/5,10-methenyltetrahydrofolate cyclohydrolase [Clostridia bacterium]